MYVDLFSSKESFCVNMHHHSICISIMLIIFSVVTNKKQKKKLVRNVFDYLFLKFSVTGFVIESDQKKRTKNKEKRVLLERDIH
jgi:hypothetical protein